MGVASLTPITSRIVRAQMQLRTQVGERIRELRQNASQAALAEAAGVSTMLVSRAERGDVSIAGLLTLANALETDIATFFGAPDVTAPPLGERALRHRIALNVRLFRMERNWTQERLGEEACISQRYVGQVENEDRCPSIDTIAGLALAFGRAPVEIVR